MRNVFLQETCSPRLPVPAPPPPALLAQTPLLSIALHTYNGDFRRVNIGLVAAGLPLLVAPFLLSRYFNQVRAPAKGGAGIN